MKSLIKNTIVVVALSGISIVFSQNLNLNGQVGTQNNAVISNNGNSTVSSNTTNSTQPDRNNANNNGNIRPNNGAGSISNTANSNNNTVNSNFNYGNSLNNGYNTYNYNNGYSNNNYNYNNYGNNPQSNYSYSNDGYGSTVEIEDANGNRTIIETTTDSSQAKENRTIQSKIDAHLVHFTGLVMSDEYKDGDLSKAYVMDGYSEFLKPGKYNNIKSTLTNSTRYTFDGIAIPPKTRLIIYSGSNLTGTKLVDVTGPAIINNSKWQFDNRYMSANSKTYITALQGTFPQSVRQWSISDMHDWQNGSIEIIEIP